MLLTSSHRYPLFNQQGAGSILACAPNLELFRAPWRRINWFATKKVGSQLEPKKKKVDFFFPSVNHADVSGCVISLERKQCTAMDTAIEKVESDKYLQSHDKSLQMTNVICHLAPTVHFHWWCFLDKRLSAVLLAFCLWINFSIKAWIFNPFFFPVTVTSSKCGFFYPF